MTTPTRGKLWWLGPWPLQPLWQFILVLAVQNWGVGEGILQNVDALDVAAWNPTLVGVGISRIGFAVLLAGLVVGVQWAIYWVSTRGRERQPVWAYVAMMVAGAAVASALVSLLLTVNQVTATLPLFAAVLAHYLILLVIITTSIGVIGSRMSIAADTAKDALAKLRAQEGRFVASEEQARRIAAEFLHDRVQADLLVIAIELRRVAESAPAGVASRISSITEVVESVRVSQVRDTSRMLSPMVQATGLSSALETLTQRWQEAMTVSLDVEPVVAELTAGADTADSTTPSLALGAYRIIEQAMLNAAAHGLARQVQVSVTSRPREGGDWLRVHVADDGAGFDPETVSGGGGFAISEVWARLLGGEWAVQSSPGRGASVTAGLPAPNR
ncbi:MAG: ATP-binding protein [Candidatus Nanopelagicales bacterium]